MDDLIRQDSDDDESTDKSPAPGSQQENSKNNRRRKVGQIYDTNDCLRGLSQLPGLIALKMLRSSDASVMRATYSTIMQHYQHSRSAPAASALSDTDVLEMLRTHPDMLNMFEHLLTDEQLQMIRRQSTDEDVDEQA